MWSNLNVEWIGDAEKKNIHSGIPMSSEYYDANSEVIHNSISSEILVSILKDLENYQEISTPQSGLAPTPDTNKKKTKKKKIDVQDKDEEFLGEDTSTLFYSLKQDGIDVKAIITLIGIIVMDKIESDEMKSMKSKISRVYIKMLCLEGSNDYSIFNPFVLQACVEHIKTLTERGKSSDFKKFFESFSVLISLFSLKNYPDLIQYVIETMIDLGDWDTLELLLVPDLHGKIDDTFEMMLHSCCKCFTEKKTTEKALAFIKNVYEHVANASELMFSFVQQLTVKLSSAKAAIRTLGAVVCSKIYMLLNVETRAKFVSYVSKFSRNAKANYRLYAVEIVSGILETLLTSQDFKEDEISSLFMIFTARTSDKASGVRTKALSCFVNVLEEAVNNDTIGSFLKTMFEDDDEPEDGEIVDPNAEEDIGGLIGQRINDPSPTVRKTAIQFVEFMSILNPKMYLTPKFLDLFLRFAVDASLSNRKQTILSLANLMRKTDNFHVIKTFMLIDLVLIFDIETSVSEKATELADEFIFKKLNGKDETFWQVISGIEPEVIANVKKVMTLFHGKKMLTSSVKTIQQRIVINPSSMNLWMLFDEYATFYPKQIDEALVLKEENEHSLSILTKISKCISENETKSLAEKIYKGLRSFTTPFIPSYIKILSEISTIDMLPLMEDCTAKIHSIVIEKAKVSENLLVKYVQTVGELAIIGVKVQPRLTTLIQALATEKFEISGMTKAHTWLTIGKMSLADVNTAKHTVPLLMTELEKSKDEIVRNNILIILCDLTVKYTSMMDRYVNKLSECINDPSSLVRRTGAVLITQLLAEDFIKWRPILFFRFSILLSDSNEKIVNAAEYALSLMLRKNQNLLFNNFIEMIFILNGIQHQVHNKILYRDVSLQGADNVKKRYILYKFLLEKLTMDQRLKIHGRFHTDVLIEFVDSNVVMDKYLVSDILAILSSREMRFNKTTIDEAFEENPDQEPTLEDKIEQTKGKLLAKVIKKHIGENVIPVIVELKRALEKQRSPLLKNIMEYLKLIMTDYKTEMKDIFSADPQLGVELEYDLRHLKMDKKTVYQSPFTKTPFKSPFAPPQEDVDHEIPEFKAPATPALKHKIDQSLTIEHLSKDLFEDETEDKMDVEEKVPEKENVVQEAPPKRKRGRKQK